MPHVSSQKLSPDILKKISIELVAVLEQAKTSGRFPSVINEIFTDTEKIMLAKRLAIIFMLSANTPQHRIVDMLKVSPTTVAKISLEIEIGKYKNILETSKKKKIDFEKLVYNFLTVGGIMPPKIGRKYWTNYIKNNK